MPAKIPAKWDREVDVVVLGSGGAGLVAATLAHDGGAETLLLEKAPLIGGTTGVSGGMPWVPRNKHMAAVGVEDSREDALTYLRRLTLGIEPDSSLLEVYVDTAHEMIDYLEAHTPLRMFSTSWFADYYHQFPGGKQRGRSIENHPFDAKQLGEWAQRLRISPSIRRSRWRRAPSRAIRRRSTSRCWRSGRRTTSAPWEARSWRRCSRGCSTAASRR